MIRCNFIILLKANNKVMEKWLYVQQFVVINLLKTKLISKVDQVNNQMLNKMSLFKSKYFLFNFLAIFQTQF